MTQITLIICTKDRPFEIDRLLHSIDKQIQLPRRILIIDGSSVALTLESGKYSNLKIELKRCFPPSLPKQRNLGISELSDEDEWVGFLDDDLVLESNTLFEIKKFIDIELGNSKLAGLGMCIENDYPIKRNWPREYMLLDTKNGGEFTLSGCPAPFKKGGGVQKVEWLSGGVSFWKKKILQEYKFDEWFKGTGYLEDVDFSFRVSREHELFLVGSAKCYHYPISVSNQKLYELGSWQIVSWWYFVSKSASFKKLFVFYSFFMIFFNNLTFGIFIPKSNRFKKAIGNLKGLLLILTGEWKKVDGFVK